MYVETRISNEPGLPISLHMDPSALSESCTLNIAYHCPGAALISMQTYK